MNGKSSAFLLVLFGLLAAGFFWFTDPWIGGARHVMSSRLNFLDAAHQAWPGTLVGLAGSAVVVLIGLWLAVRRSA